MPHADAACRMPMPHADANADAAMPMPLFTNGHLKRMNTFTCPSATIIMLSALTFL